MKRESRLLKAFGRIEVDSAGSIHLADLPAKISGTFISRVTVGRESGCTFCFPHGWETVNSRRHPWQRNWKRRRRFQWRR